MASGSRPRRTRSVFGSKSFQSRSPRSLPMVLSFMSTDERGFIGRDDIGQTSPWRASPRSTTCSGTRYPTRLLQVSYASPSPAGSLVLTDRPALHNAVWKELDPSRHYALCDTYDVAQPHFKQLVREDPAFAGAAVTMPLKVTVTAPDAGILDDLTPAARAIGAVNTIVVEVSLLPRHDQQWADS